MVHCIKMLLKNKLIKPSNLKAVSLHLICDHFKNIFSKIFCCNSWKIFIFSKQTFGWLHFVITVKFTIVLFIHVFCLTLELLCISFFSYDASLDRYYYYNAESGVSQWEHPLDSKYKEKVRRGRSEGYSSAGNYFFH